LIVFLQRVIAPLVLKIIKSVTLKR
jgi:hypothetical protein